MRMLEEEFMDYKQRVEEKKLPEDEIRCTVNKSKQAFYESDRMLKSSGFEFLYEQSFYIKKRWWMLQILVLTGLWAWLYYSKSSVIAQRSMGVLMPVFAILLIPELWKNRCTASMEIEGAAYYTLRQIYAARMLLFAMADVLILSIFLIVLPLAVRMPFGDIMICFFLPLVVTCAICFRTLGSNRINSESFAVALCLVWAAVWNKIILKDDIYAAISGPVWAGVIVLSVLYLGFSVYKGLKGCGNYWEVNML